MGNALLEFAETIRAAGSAGRHLRIRGGGTKDFYGQSLEGDVLDVRAHSGIVAYDPTEIVITVRGGTPLAEVEETLRKENQMLPFEPPYFGAGGTIGGAVAAGLSGPRRAAAGAVRDFVLGARLMDGRGDELTFGGQVMKNVAGYDVSRLMAGSIGNARNHSRRVDESAAAACGGGDAQVRDARGESARDGQSLGRPAVADQCDRLYRSRPRRATLRRGRGGQRRARETRR